MLPNLVKLTIRINHCATQPKVFVGSLWSLGRLLMLTFYWLYKTWRPTFDRDLKIRIMRIIHRKIRGHNRQRDCGSQKGERHAGNPVFYSLLLHLRCWIAKWMVLDLCKLFNTGHHYCSTWSSSPSQSLLSATCIVRQGAILSLLVAEANSRSRDNWKPGGPA